MIFVKNVLKILMILLCIPCYPYTGRGWDPIDVKSYSSTSYSDTSYVNVEIQTNSVPTVTLNASNTYNPYSHTLPYYNDELRHNDKHSASNVESPSNSNDKFDSSNMTNKNEYDHLSEFARDERVRDLASGESLSNQSHYAGGKIVVHELMLPKGAILTPLRMQDKVLDSTMILEKVHTLDGLIEVLASDIIQARFERVQYLIKTQCNDRSYCNCKEMLEKQSLFIDQLLSGHVSELLHHIGHSDIVQAEQAFAALKQLWPYERDYSFLLRSVHGNGELIFYQHERLGVNIMKIAESELITRQDYLRRNCNNQSLKVINEYKDKCIELQKQGDIRTLLDEKLNLYRAIVENENKHDFIAIAQLAIVEKIYDDPVAQVFRIVKNSRSLVQARDELKCFERHVIDQARQKNITYTKDVKKWVTDKYGFDALEVGRSHYVSRVDFVPLPEFRTLFSDRTFMLFYNIENGTFADAHEELVHCVNQLKDIFAGLNITDESAQKEYLMKEFGVNVMPFARNLYEHRADYQNLISHFVPVDVSQSVKTILETQTNQVEVAAQFSDVSQQVFNNARLFDADMTQKVEPHVDRYIAEIRSTKDIREFAFHTVMVDRILSDVQAKVQAAVQGKPTVLERSPELAMRGVTKFICALSPVTQIKNMGDLASHGIILLGRALTGTVNVALHPCQTAESIYCFASKSCELLVHTACFVSDATVGKLYLMPDEYKERINALSDSYDAISNELQKLTAEQVVDVVAQIAADIVFAKGMGNVYIYLKEINAIAKMQNRTASIAWRLKNAINAKLEKVPTAVTPEGIVLKMKKGVGPGGGAAKEVVARSGALVHEGPIAIFKDGYYEVNGFKFTEYYYNRLWNNGRGAPSLAAEAILKKPTEIIPDPMGISGFFKYSAEGWEMIYNPTTKVVSHIQPIKKAINKG